MRAAWRGVRLTPPALCAPSEALPPFNRFARPS